MDALGRYYTNDIISSLLIDNFEFKAPKKILDLGVGDASLSIAAFGRWTSAEFFGTEIEKLKAGEISKNLSFLKVYNYDTLHPNTSARLKIKFGSIDIAICNPPYLKIEDKSKYNNLFKSVGCNNFLKLKRITSEIVFFAHNLKLLKKKGELGIIVSDSLVTGKEFEIFRQTIFKKFNVRKIIQLPDNIFSKTEARTHIIFISKAKPILATCELLLSSSSGKLSKEIKVDKSKLSFRMDYQFFKSKMNSISSIMTLKDIGAIIKRGKHSYKELRESKMSYFHSTDYKNNKLKLEFGKPVGRKHRLYTAFVGDILICRVGKRILGKAAIINKGSVIYSDCIYKITVPLKFQNIVLNSFLSLKGQKWLKAYSHGVCAQVISKSDIENFPIFSI